MDSEKKKSTQEIGTMTAKLYVLFGETPDGKKLKAKGMYGDEGVRYWSAATEFKEKRLRDWIYFDKNPFEGIPKPEKPKKSIYGRWIKK